MEKNMIPVGKVFNNKDGVIGEAKLERKAGVKDPCDCMANLICNIRDCLYCEDCYYKITL